MMVASTFNALLLLVIVVGVVGVDCVGEKRVVPLHKLQWPPEKNPSRLSPQRSRRERAASTLEMKHHTYNSVVLDNFSGDENRNLLLTDEARVLALQSRFKGAAASTRIPLISGVKLQTLNYVVTIKIGGRDATVIVDTGSDLTWAQCSPCSYCYNQQEPLIESSASPSYRAIRCNSTVCNSLLRSATGNPGNCSLDRSSCYYDLGYGDGSYTRGVLARETINLGGALVKKFIFGCGRNNRGLFGGASGIMGLGRTKLSLISQTSSRFGGVFSYCLPAHAFNSSGSLVLGDDSNRYRNSTPVSYTRMIFDPRRAPFYFVNLTGVSVGGVALRATGISNGNKIMIDSGTVITRVVPSVYNVLRAEFVKQFSNYPPAPSFSILDACFDLSSYEEVSVPTIRLGFEGGGGVDVDVTGVLYFARKDASQVCLAVASLLYEEEVGIIGNYQQKNLRVVYDTMGSRLGFAHETCDYERDN